MEYTHEKKIYKKIISQADLSYYFKVEVKLEKIDDKECYVVFFRDAKNDREILVQSEQIS